jgi:hypothetical protein
MPNVNSEIPTEAAEKDKPAVPTPEDLRAKAEWRQEKRLEGLPRGAANQIASGRMPFADLLKCGRGTPFDVVQRMEAAVIARKGGAPEAAEAWLKEQYKLHGNVNTMADCLPVLGVLYQQLESGTPPAAAVAAPAATAPAPAASAPNANVPLAETFLALDGPEDADARAALWLAHENEFMNPDSVRAYGTNATTRIDLIRAMWPLMPSTGRNPRSQFWGRHSKLLFD